MEIYLKHPLHGAKVAYMDSEAEYDETNGWKRYIPSVEEDCVEEEDDLDAPTTNAFERKRRRR
jgi:hypothetical protein